MIFRGCFLFFVWKNVLIRHKSKSNFECFAFWIFVDVFFLKTYIKKRKKKRKRKKYYQTTNEEFLHLGYNHILGLWVREGTLFWNFLKFFFGWAAGLYPNCGPSHKIRLSKLWLHASMASNLTASYKEENVEGLGPRWKLSCVYWWMLQKKIVPFFCKGSRKRREMRVQWVLSSTSPKQRSPNHKIQGLTKSQNEVKRKLGL
jgi:hypothetical protein